MSVGYRVNSKIGIAFRKWANNVLKQFILQGYAINEKRLQALKKTVDIQSRMLADALDIGMAANALTKYLNIKCGRLKDEYGISYENKAKHSGRRVTLTLMPLDAAQ